MANFKKHSGNYISTKSLGIDWVLTYPFSPIQITLLKQIRQCLRYFFLQICTTMINLFTEGSILFDDFGMVTRKTYHRSKGAVKVIRYNAR